jgi:hypothetical protein
LHDLAGWVFLYLFTSYECPGRAGDSVAVQMRVRPLAAEILLKTNNDGPKIRWCWRACWLDGRDPIIMKKPGGGILGVNWGAMRGLSLAERCLEMKGWLC